MIVVCPKCGTENRLPDAPDPARRYRCGKCKTRLPHSAEAPAVCDVRTSVVQFADGEEKENATSESVVGFRKAVVLHPLLLAVFPVLALYAYNAAEVTPSDVVVPLTAALGLGCFLLLLIQLLAGLARRARGRSTLRHPKQTWDIRKAGIVASLFVLLFFSYGHVLIWLGWWDTLHRSYVPYLWAVVSIAWLVLLLVGVRFVVKTRRNLHRLTVILNMFAAALVIVATINVVVREVGDDDSHGVASQDNVETVSLNPEKALALPDIYYIILDRYASTSTLNELYGFDNSAFTDYLLDSGFYVAHESVANYWGTGDSLRSSLNLDFIHKEAAEGPIGGNMRDYKVWRFLKSNGYKYVHFGSWLEATRENPYADMNFNYYSMPEFSWFLFQTTWAYPICAELNIVDAWWEAQYKRVLYKFEKLAEIPDMIEPTFVFAHMLIPHPPFVFDREGNFIEGVSLSERDYRAQYVDQLVATNMMVRTLIDKLLSDSGVPPIIILQADEGPRREDLIVDDPSWAIWKAGEQELREKMRILNAYYLPGIAQDTLYPSISPVNSFRLVFNQYFGRELELLPDRSYVRDSEYNFIDVTDKVKYENLLQ